MVAVAVVGMGWWGRTMLDVLDESESVQVAMAIDPDPEALATAKSRGMTVATDYAAALKSSFVDAVVLCTPHRLHPEQVVAAARAGKHVFCEKPFSMTLADAVAAIDAAREADVRVGIGHEKRFEPGVQLIQQTFASGDLGTGLVLEGNFSQDKFLSLPNDSWRLSAEHAPAGPLSATGIHLVDLAISLFGWPDHVWARLATRATEFGNGDTLTITIGFPSGATALLTAILTTPFVGRLCLLGSRGWMEVRDRAHPEAPQGWDVMTQIRDAAPTRASFPPSSAVAANVEAFAQSIVTGAEYPFTPEQILATAAATEAIMASIRSGAVEPVARSYP